MGGMRRAYLGIGSNVGDRERHVRDGLRRLRERGIDVRRVSSAWETEPLDGAGPGWFLNLVAEVGFPGSPPELLDALQEVERAAGRTRERPNEPRELDLDVLWIEGLEWRDDRLCVPHPRMWVRAFVLAPLAEVDPGLRRPSDGRTVRDLLGEAEGRVRCLGAFEPAGSEPSR